MNMSIQGPLLDQGEICEHILRALPQWFGIESAILEYVEHMAAMPTFVVLEDGDVVGFMGLKLHSAQSAEIYVMGILPGYHRRGLGRGLFEEGCGWLRSQGVSFLQVKTVSASSTDPSYAKTRQFYTALGFVSLEEFKTLWGAHNPCLQMILAL